VFVGTLHATVTFETLTLSTPISSTSSRFLSSGFASLYTSVFLLSLNGLFAKSIQLDSTSITHLRSVIAALGIACLLLIRRHSLTLPTIKTSIIVYGLGVILGLHWVTFFHAMQVSSVAVGIIALFSYPVLTVLIEPFFRHSSPKGIDIAAAIIVFIGVVTMVSGEESLVSGNIREGVFWGITSALLFSLRNTSQKYLAHHVPSSHLMLHQTIATALIFVGFTDWPTVATLDLHNWWLLALLGIFCTAGAHTLLSVSLKLLSAKTVALISCLQPLLASLFAWMMIGETLTPHIAVGGAIVLTVATYESFQKKAA